MTLAIAHSRGWLDYEERVATYWPSLRSWKEAITVRQLLAHQAGLFARQTVDRAVVADLVASRRCSRVRNRRGSRGRARRTMP
jgi:CubicO group peptidase (beta-lactamase class C family)